MKKYLNLKNDMDYTKLKQPAEIIKQGGIVVFPTETVYGIGTNALDEKAVEKLYNIKKRPANKPISLLVANIDMINEIVLDTSSLEINRKVFSRSFYNNFKKERQCTKYCYSKPKYCWN